MLKWTIRWWAPRQDHNPFPHQLHHKPPCGAFLNCRTRPTCPSFQEGWRLTLRSCETAPNPVHSHAMHLSFHSSFHSPFHYPRFTKGGVQPCQFMQRGFRKSASRRSPFTARSGPGRLRTVALNDPLCVQVFTHNGPARAHTRAVRFVAAFGERSDHILPLTHGPRARRAQCLSNAVRGGH